MIFVVRERDPTGRPCSLARKSRSLPAERNAIPNRRSAVNASPREHRYDERLVGGALVRITELVGPDQRRSYQVHLPDSDVDLTGNGRFDDPPTDEQISALLAGHGATWTTTV